MTIEKLKKAFKQLGCSEFWAKELAPNDNTKQQVYVAPNFQAINFIPHGEIYSATDGKRKKATFKANLDFSWLDEHEKPHSAPSAKLIWYPDYPEVRFSGFLVGCPANVRPSKLMAEKPRKVGRVLFLGINTIDGKVFGKIVANSDALAKEFKSYQWAFERGPFKSLLSKKVVDTKKALLKELWKIYAQNWITGRRLDKTGKLLQYSAPNAGGFTLEALLNIIPNSVSEPDYLGWEVKQYTVTDLNKILGKTITLMAPEPDGGVYSDDFVKFVKDYGRSGKTGGTTFNGVHRVDLSNSKTNMRLEIDGYDFVKSEITKSNGCVALLTKDDKIAAQWSFEKLLDHWEKKHEKAVYVPGLARKGVAGKEYRFGNNVLLGTGTSFKQFITAMSYGIVYYDPGLSVRGAKTKKRSQFRFSTNFIRGLYHEIEEVELKP